MIRTASVFALALLSGAASAQTLSSVVNGLLGTGGASTAPLTAPLSAALSTPVSMLDGVAQPVTGTAPLPGLAPSKASGDLLAVGVLDGNNTGNDGSISAAVLSGTDSGQAPAGEDGLSVGVLNTDDPLHLTGCFSGTCQSLPNPLPADLTDPLLDVSDALYDGLRGTLIPLTTETLAALTDPAGGALETVVNSIPVTGATLFGGPTNNNTTPNDTVNAGVLSGDNSGSGGDVGVAVLSTSASSNPDSSARSGMIGAGVLNGNGPATTNTVTVVAPGSNPGDNDESAQRNDDSELCAILAKDNRGQVKGKLREKAHCLKTKIPKA